MVAYLPAPDSTAVPAVFVVKGITFDDAEVTANAEVCLIVISLDGYDPAFGNVNTQAAVVLKVIYLSYS